MRGIEGVYFDQALQCYRLEPEVEEGEEEELSAVDEYFYGLVREDEEE